MQQSLIPFICSFLITQRLIRFSKINNHEQWVQWFNYLKYFSIFLIIVSPTGFTTWIWHILLIGLLLYVFLQNELLPLRTFFFAFVPYVAVRFLNDFVALVANNFYKQWDSYFNTAIMLSVIWLGAMLFSQYKQNKAAEKERLQRQREDEINRAIAQRKVELEVLVVERTAEITKQKEELEHTLEELKATQAQLIQSEKMASLGELTAGIAHEIQNPLNFVNNFSEISIELLNEMMEELASQHSGEVEAIASDIRQNLEKIVHHGKRADSIVKGMLQHSRSNSGVKEPTDINALCDEYLRLAYHGLRAKDKSFNATLKTNFDEALGKIDIVPQEIGRVILNLLTNAFYAVSEKKNQLEKEAQSGDGQSAKQVYEPSVLIGTKKLDTKIEIVVRDNGNGIPEEALDKIFQPFFTTKPTGKGTGLGLSMSYEIVTKAHGGELKVENNEAEGVTFTIVLPVKE